MSGHRLSGQSRMGTLRRFGFQFPQEHGLTAIWSASTILSLGFILASKADSWGTLLSILFAIIILLSSESISRVIRSRNIHASIIPGILVSGMSLLSVALYLTTPFEHFLFGLVIFTFLSWALLSAIFGAQSTVSLSLGAFSLSAIFPLLVAMGSTVGTMEETLHLLAIWWLFSGLTVVLVLHVQVVRRKTSKNIPIIIWAFFLIAFIPVILTGLASVWVLLSTIEPTLHGIRKAFSRTRTTQKLTRKEYKIMGRNLTLRLLLFVGIILVVKYFAD